MINLKKLKWIIIFLVLSITFVSCSSNNNNQNSVEVSKDITEEIHEITAFADEALNYYSIDASLDSDKAVINVTQTVTYTNFEEIDLAEVYFHLYPNAFDKDSHPNLFDTDKNEITEQSGYVDIISVEINGQSVEAEMGYIETVLKIKYDEMFKRGETYSIKLVYHIGISSTSERFGVVNGLYNLGNWYPVLAVYDEDGWNLDPYYYIGDPFYSDVSNYDITFEVPKDFIVAASGYANDISYEDDRKVYKFRGDRIRDFAMVVSDRFKIISEVVNDTIVYVYYPEELKGNVFIDNSLEYAATAIDLFSETIGLYPYKTYSVCITNFPSGMEYPGLVMISTKYYNGQEEDIRRVIVHETGHQWFFGIIGNDEIDEGWIDEGLTSYITAFYDLKYLGENIFDGTVASYEKRLTSAGGKDNVEMIKSAHDYFDWTEYGLAAYTKSFLMANELYEIYGEEKFIEFLKTLFDEYKYGIMKQKDYVRVAKSVFDGDLDEFFESWLK